MTSNLNGKGIRSGLVRFGIGFLLSLLVGGVIGTRFHKVDSEVDRQFGVVIKPGQAAWDHLEGNGYGYWTSEGIRRVSLPTDSDEAPILLVGNSYTEGLQVTDEEHYGHIVEKELRRLKKKIPVLPYGKSGASVADYLASAPDLLAVFKPRWTIVQVSERDFQDRAWSAKPPGEARLELDHSQNRIKVAIQPLPARTGKSLIRRVAERFPNLVPYSLTYRRVQEFKIWFNTEKPWFRPDAPTVPRSGAVAHKYPVEEEVKMLADAYGRRLTILYLPRFDPADPCARNEWEMTFRNLAAKQGIRFVSLGDKFNDLARSGNTPYGFANTQFNFGHWNRYGHEAAAQLLLEDLLKLGL